jgi:NAD+ kinase
MKRIGLIVNAEKPKADRAAAAVLADASRLGLSVLMDSACGTAVPAGTEAAPVCDFERLGAEAVVVLGGDGTMLDAARRLSGSRLPLMGLNIGSLGYLTSVEESMFGKALRQLRDDEFTLSMRATLSAQIVHADGRPGRLLPDALNDVVVSRGASGSAVELDLEVNGLSVSRFLCDGLIVATPTGSTAYSLSAGGPILLPGVEALVINLICPHTLTSRPLVVRNTARIFLKAVSAGSPLIVCADGRDDEQIQIGDGVRIETSSRRIPIITLQDYNPYDVMRRKLGWGGRSHVPCPKGQKA